MARWPAAALVAAIGCGDDAPSIKLAELHAASVEARCGYYVRCGLFADAATCGAFFRAPDERSLVAAVEAGTIRYDGVAAKRCQDELATLTCDQTSRDVRVRPSCEAMFRGAVAEGGACAMDLECQSGACDRPQCRFDMCCPGICLSGKRGGVGSACTTDVQCSESYCGADRVCRALAKLGEPCRIDGHCDYGAACIGASELMDGACRAMPLIGERCPYQRCAELGVRCAAGSCAPVGLPGTACADNVDCSSFAQCGPEGTCIDVPTLGMPCTTTCAGESWCDRGVCAMPLDNTTPCLSDDQCASLFCNEGMLFDACATRPVCI